MYKTILVPLDGSKRAEAILPFVESLAECYSAEVILLRVIEPQSQIVGPDYIYPVLDEYVLEQQTQDAKTYLTNQQGQLQEKGIRSQVHVVHGPVVKAIIATAEREEAELIAMASHGRTGLARVFYGSVAAGVLHLIDRPLLLIRSLGND